MSPLTGIVVRVAVVCAGVCCVGGAIADEAVERRLQELEAETQALREQVRELSERPVRLPPVEAAPAAPMPEMTLAAEQSAAPADEQYMTVDEMKDEMKKLVWTKGDFKVVPYGSLWGSVIYDTERSFPGPYTLYVYSASDQGESDFVIDTRRTRIGLDVAGPRIPFFANAESSGRLEIDFHGAFVVENKPGVLLRHAYGLIKNERFGLLAGQTSDVISPLYPGTLSYSVGWGGGNIGYRRAQVRLDRYLDLAPCWLATLQGSVNQNIISDLTGTAGVRPEATGWPVIEGRLGFTYGPRGKGCHPAEFGFSGHIGEQGFDFTTAGPSPFVLPPRDDVRVRTWSFNVDVRIPVTERWGLQGEYFTGENLSTFLGGVIQGVSPYTRRPIRACGGWGEVWYDLTPRLHSHAGFGIDDPFDVDIVEGRSYNHFIFANVSFDVISTFNVGVEVTSWKTLYRDVRPGHTDPEPGESVQFEFTGKYNF